MGWSQQSPDPNPVEDLWVELGKTFRCALTLPSSVEEEIKIGKKLMQLWKEMKVGNERHCMTMKVHNNVCCDQR